MTVSLPDDVAAFVDKQVETGQADSRSAAIAVALRHEQRRIAAQRDAAIYAADQGSSDELDAFVEYASRLPLDIA